MLKATTAFVLDPDPLDRAWIASVLASVVEFVTVLEEAPVAADLVQGHGRGCLVVCTEPDEGLALELVRELRRRGSQLPAIILVSHAAFRTAIELARLDATVFLERPLSALQLRNAVRKACEPSPLH